MNQLVEQFAEKYLRRVRFKEEFVSTACPFHKGGNEKHPSFWVHKKTGRWGCFTCSTNGSSLTYLLRNLGVKDRALEAIIEEESKKHKEDNFIEKASKEKKGRAEFKGTSVLPEALLGVFDYLPLDLRESGFSEAILREHDIGFDKRLSRITFPIRDVYGSLVGVSGRATLFGDLPKYLFYSGRRIQDGKETLGQLGEWYPEYNNASVRDHLWRGEKVYKDLIDGLWDQIIVVEGFKAALWLVQCGWYHTVAIMGTHMSLAQERLLKRFGATVFVLADNNDPGRKASKAWCSSLSNSSFHVYEVSYPPTCGPDVQPDSLSQEELEKMFQGAKRQVGVSYGFRRRLGSHAQV